MVTLFDNETILKGYTREKVNAARAEWEREQAIEIAKKMLKKALPIDLISLN